MAIGLLVEHSLIREMLEQAGSDGEIRVVVDNARTHINHSHSQPKKRTMERGADVAPRIPRREAVPREARVDWNPFRWESSSPKKETEKSTSSSTKQDSIPVLKSRSLKKCPSASCSLFQLQKQSFQELRRRANKEKVEAIIQGTFSTSVLSSSPDPHASYFAGTMAKLNLHFVDNDSGEGREFNTMEDLLGCVLDSPSLNPAAVKRNFSL